MTSTDTRSKAQRDYDAFLTRQAKRMEPCCLLSHDAELSCSEAQTAATANRQAREASWGPALVSSKPIL